MVYTGVVLLYFHQFIDQGSIQTDGSVSGSVHVQVQIKGRFCLLCLMSGFLMVLPKNVNINTRMAIRGNHTLNVTVVLSNVTSVTTTFSAALILDLRMLK